MILAVLPDEARTDLAPHGFPGLVAVWRPMDLEDKARWFQECGGAGIESTMAALLAVKRQLITVEGVEAEETVAGGEPRRVSFDGRNPDHFRRLPLRVVMPVYNEILARAGLSEESAKN